MTWSNLAFLHWRVEPERVQRVVPLPLELWEGHAWVGLVPFLMEDIRLAFMPRRFQFPETNLRTYVIGPDRRPGVWFFSLDAADRMAVAGARAWFGLNYRHARMTCAANGDTCEAQSQRLRASAFNAKGLSRTWIEREDAESRVAEPGTLEFFLLERYLLFAQRRGRIVSGRVAHEPYRWRPARAAIAEQDLTVAAGLGRLDRQPDHCAMVDPLRVRGYAPRPSIRH